MPPSSTAFPAGVRLGTKLNAPVGARRRVAREALVDRLVVSEPRRLTLIDAPAGWGKTTLLAEWAADRRERRGFAWFAVDRGDNDPVRFWAYAIEALRGVAPTVGTSSLPALGVSGTDPVEVVLPPLINELAALDERLVLVLEDYHVITSAAVHEGVAFLLDHSRRHSSSRSRPGSTRRCRSRACARGARCSSCGRPSCASTRTRPRSCSPRRSATRSPAPTSSSSSRAPRAGRPASTSRRSRSAGATTRPGSSWRSPATTATSSTTSAARCSTASTPPRASSCCARPCWSGCAGRSATTCSARPSAARRLAEIERANLFLVALDGRREWFRYHHLFGDLLRYELERSEPELIPDLHRRAAEWLGGQGAIDDAIRHLLAAGDAEPAAALVAESWRPPFNRGQLATVDRWLDDLPERTVLAEPGLCLARAWVLLDSGRPHEVERWLPGAARGASGEAAVLRAVLTFKLGRIAEAERVAGEALAVASADSPLGLTVASIVLGIARYCDGALDAAAEALDEAVRLAAAGDNTLARIYALGYLA